MTQVRALLGLINYYRRFVPDFAAVTAHLTDLTRKGQPNKVTWTDSYRKALERVQTALTSDPYFETP